MSLFEYLGTFFGLVSVWLTVREHIGCWPTSIANVLLFFVSFAQARLYAEIVTYSMFLVLSIHGWYEWLHGGPQRGARVVTRTPRGELVIVLACVAAAGPALGWLLAHHTRAALPYWDSLITALSFGAQVLLNRKRLESWLLWIAVDLIGIPVYLSKGLYATGGLYVVYLGLASAGYWRWRRGLTAPRAPYLNAHP
jgi:nicotinamide mononucleotide transporter